jgi:hypothetical protein
VSSALSDRAVAYTVSAYSPGSPTRSSRLSSALDVQPPRDAYVIA